MHSEQLCGFTQRQQRLEAVRSGIVRRLAGHVLTSLQFIPKHVCFRRCIKPSRERKQRFSTEGIRRFRQAVSHELANANYFEPRQCSVSNNFSECDYSYR